MHEQSWKSTGKCRLTMVTLTELCMLTAERVESGHLLLNYGLSMVSCS